MTSHCSAWAPARNSSAYLSYRHRSQTKQTYTEHPGSLWVYPYIRSTPAGIIAFFMVYGLIKTIYTTIFALPIIATAFSWGGYSLHVANGYLTDLYLETSLRWHATPTQTTDSIEQALDEQRFEMAESLIGLNRTLGYPHNPKWDQQLQNADSALVKTRDFIGGAITGDTRNQAALTGTIAADLTVIGDVRDLAQQGYRYSQGNEADMLLVSLSTIGLATTLYPVADLGVSISKTAVRQGKRFLPFTRFLQHQLRRTVDWPKIQRALRQLSPSVDAISLFGKRVNKAIHGRRANRLFSDIGLIKRYSGNMKNTLDVLQYVSNRRGLAAAKRLTQRFRHRSAAVLKLTAGRALKILVRGSQGLLWIMATLISSLLVMLEILYLCYRLGKRWMPIKQVHAASVVNLN